MIFSNLFNDEGSIYMEANRQVNGCSVGIFGVNYDHTTSYRPGARFGPNAIRNVSQSLETFCPELNRDLLDIQYCDLGTLNLDSIDSESVIKKVYKGSKFLLKNNLKPLIFGGEHSITTGIIKALIERYPNIILLQLDAHADLRNTYQGNRNSHACTMRRCIEILKDKTIFQLGIRSGTKEEFKEMNQKKQLIDFKCGDNNNLLKKTLEPYKYQPIYLTIDIDWFDPSLVSGTGTPEPGGFFWNDFNTVIKTLNFYNIVGADLVELSPNIDLSGISNIVAAKVARSLIMTLDKSDKKELI